ncbi:MAG: DUF1015 domain-containing protein [Planctomycetota bacterium]
MADVRPFPGDFYNSARVPDLSAVVVPPYDVISPADRAVFAARHPASAVHVDLPEAPAGADRYAHAAEILAGWRRDRILVRDEKPAFYLITQKFTHGGREFVRRGIFARVKLSPFGDGDVFPHEATLPGPKQDRLALMRATKGNLSPIFGLYEDADGAVKALLDAAAGEPPRIAFWTEREGECQLWAISDPERVDRLASLLRSKRLIIADGHHRYETALAYRAERRAAEGNPSGEQPYDFILMACVAFEDPGLLILPTHRIVKDRKGISPAELLKRISGDFEIRLTGGGLGGLLGAMGRENSRVPLGLYDDGKFYLLLPNPGALERGLAKLPAALRGMNTAALQNMILGPHLGVVSKEELAYTPDAAEAVRRVDASEGAMAFFLNAISAADLREIALAGQVTPPKTTYFFPKLPTGAVFHLFE